MTAEGDVHLRGNRTDGGYSEGGHLVDDHQQTTVPLGSLPSIGGVLVVEVLAKEVAVGVILVEDELRVPGGLREVHQSGVL